MQCELCYATQLLALILGITAIPCKDCYVPPTQSLPVEKILEPHLEIKRYDYIH